MRLGDTFRFNGHHKKGPTACGAKFSVVAVYSWDPARKSSTKCADFWRAEDGREFASGGFGLVYVCACGRQRTATPVRGKYNPGKKCNSLCQAAIGHDCECACGGKNHGAGHEATA